MPAYRLDNLPGIATRQRVFNTSRRLPGQVFALELLSRPVVLRRDASGAIEVTVDRRGVTHAVYTSEGKNALCRAALAGSAYDEARALEERVHGLMTGASGAGELKISCAKFPLRWASAGVFPVVEWREHTWTPFFFRDIPPVGWNIAAGGSDDDAELNDPVAFGLREFVEETIVLPGAPEARASITPRTFGGLLGRASRARPGAMRRTLTALNRHLALRTREDGVHYTPFSEAAVPPERSISARADATRTTLRIIDDNRESEVRNILVCINVFELGIEVIGVVRFDLGDDEVLLDGETYEPAQGDLQLIRMPVAMISHDYLREVFGAGCSRLDWRRPLLREYDTTREQWVGRAPAQPSVVPMRTPRVEEVSVFGWDAGVRRCLGESSRASWNAVSTAVDVRHVRWLKNFARYFENLEGAAATRGEAVCGFPWFTAGSAKSALAFFGAG